jgi:lysozyme family protein
MKGQFEVCIVRVLAHEGGFVNHPLDPGQATNLGITRATLAAWRKRPVTVDEVKRLTRAEAERIYRAQYWDTIRGDELPPGVDYAVFDISVNSGPGRAAKFLQQALRVEADGVVGSKTIAAAVAVSDVGLAREVCRRRLAWVRTLKTWRTFGKGWNSRVADVQRVAVAMADKLELPAVAVAAVGQAKARQADVSKVREAIYTPQGRAKAIRAAGAAGTALTTISTAIQPLSETWQWVGAASVALFVGGIITLAIVKAMEEPDATPKPEAA